VEISKAEACERSTAVRKILTADGAADREKRTCERRRHLGEVGHGSEERETEPQVLAHVAVLRQHDLLAPIAGIGETVMRAAAIHPDFTFLGVVVGKRKVRRAVS